MVHKLKWIKTDEMRGYYQPEHAVAGSSDTGTWEDSPCPTPEVNRELSMLSDHLESKGFKVKRLMTRSSNVFMGKKWLVVESRFKEAKAEANHWIKGHASSTSHVHEAD